MTIGVLASHEGTTLQSLIDASLSGRLSGRVAVVVSNNSESGALARARRAGIRALHASSTTHGRSEAVDAAIRDALLDAKVDLVFLAGYMKPVGPLTLAAFTGRILNTHPALLPKFGGEGMYGDRVFEAVLQAKESESGVSIHLVDSGYDTGPVVARCTVPVFPNESLESLKFRVREREKAFVVETLAEIAEGRLTLDRRFVARAPMLRFAPIDLTANGSDAVAFRADSFGVSFGTSEPSFSEWGREGVGYLEHLRTRMTELPDSCVHVWLDSTLVGQIELRGGRDDPSEGYVNLYYLIPEKRGAGLGAELDRYAVEWFTSRGLSRAGLGVSPTNERAVRFYLKHGWTDCGVHPRHPTTTRLMRKTGFAKDSRIR